MYVKLEVKANNTVHFFAALLFLGFLLLFTSIWSSAKDSTRW